MKTIKKTMCIFLSLVLGLSFSVLVYAEADDTEKNNIIISLQNIEAIKSSVGLEDIEFSELCVSEPLYAYDYVDSTVTLNLIFYPLKINEDIVAFAVKSDSMDNYQITSALSDKVNLYYDNNKEYAIIYAYDGCYLYDGNQIQLLNEIPADTTRDTINLNNLIANNNNIIFSDIGTSFSLNYTSQQQSRALTYYSCDVDYVTQQPHGNICWAATIACIVNCKKGTNYSAVDVAIEEYGETNFNQKLPISDEADILFWDYGLLYTYRDDIPGDSVIAKNVNNNFPIAATFQGPNSYHLVTVFGVDSIRGYITLMDPLFGSTSASFSSSVMTYQYVSPLTGNTFTFDSASCRYWSV